MQLPEDERPAQMNCQEHTSSPQRFLNSALPVMIMNDCDNKEIILRNAGKANGASEIVTNDFAILEGLSFILASLKK